MKKIVAGIVVFALAFLLGYVPQYVEKRDLQSQLTLAREKLATSELQSLAGSMLLEVQRQNFGVAREYSTQYFARLDERSASLQDSPLKVSLQQLLDKRDSITASLAKADSASTAEVQALFAQTQELAKVQR